MGSNIRTSTAYVNFARRVKQLDRAWTCYRCEQSIDPDLKYPDPMCWTLDHKTPLDQGGELIDLDNAAGSHSICNSTHGRSLQDRRQSRAW